MRKILFLLFLPCFLLSQTTDWVKSFGGLESDKGISIGTDSLGFIYISGYYNSSADFDQISVVNNPSSGTNKENFVAKLDSNGNVLWVVPGGNQENSCCDDRALGMHVTPGGDVFITGTFWSSYYLGVRGAPGTINVPGNQRNAHDNSLLAKIDKDGNPEWVIGFGGDNTSGGCPYPIYDADDHSYDVKVDADGFIYVTGFFSGYDADFDGFTIVNPDWGTDCTPMGYIGKLDSNGTWLWVDKFDGIKDARGSRDNRLAIDNFSNIYCVGGFENTANYGPYSLTSNGEWDAFIFKMDKEGNWLWADKLGSNKSDRANSIAIDICDDIYITGEYRNPMVFSGANASNGSDTLSHKQKRDVFVAKMNNQGQWKWAKRARSSGTDKSYQMSVDINKQVFVCGTTGGAAGDSTKFSDNLIVPPQISNDTTMSSWVAQIDGSTNTGDWLWAKLAGSNTDDDDRVNDICSDGFGNVYAVGFFEDRANFDGILLDATARKKDIFVWKMSMTPGSFSYNNSVDTVFYSEVVYNPLDTGVFLQSSFMVDGCDTLFTDSIIERKLGVKVIFDINNIGSAIISINGQTQNLPIEKEYLSGDVINISAQIDPNWLFDNWYVINNNVVLNVLTTSFTAINGDSCILKTKPKPPLTAFINGNDTICSNTQNNAQVKIYFSEAIPPYSFVYKIDGVDQPLVTTSDNPYTITTNQEGLYTLSSFNDASSTGWCSGSAYVTIQEAPQAIFSTSSDTISVLYTNVRFVDESSGDISSWEWDFGDNTFLSNEQNPIHNYEDSVGIIEVSLLVVDNRGCKDSTFKQLWLENEFWIYLPNSFTPDNNGVNDYFCLYYNGIIIETFYFNIYNRNSDLVYTTSDINDLKCMSNNNGWDGLHYQTGNKLPFGTYVYEIYFQDFEGWKHGQTGTIHLIR